MQFLVITTAFLSVRLFDNYHAGVFWKPGVTFTFLRSKRNLFLLFCSTNVFNGKPFLLFAFSQFSLSWVMLFSARFEGHSQSYGFERCCISMQPAVWMPLHSCRLCCRVTALNPCLQSVFSIAWDFLNIKNNTFIFIYTSLCALTWNVMCHKLLNWSCIECY